MIFLVDVQLPPRLCQWLESKGHQTRHVMSLENGLTLPDSRLWEIAKQFSEIIISKDWDFYERAILDNSPAQVFHIALGNCSNERLFLHLERTWDLIEDALQKGATLVSITQSHINVFPGIKA